MSLVNGSSNKIEKDLDLQWRFLFLDFSVLLQKHDDHYESIIYSIVSHVSMQCYQLVHSTLKIDLTRSDFLL